MDTELQTRLMKLHQEYLETTLSSNVKSGDNITLVSTLVLTNGELEDLCEFLNAFLYD